MLIYKSLNLAIKSTNDDDFTITGIFSTKDEDRHGEIVEQNSWELSEYLKNPVVLFAHGHQQPAIGKVISLGFNEDGNLEGVIQFAAKEYEFAHTIYKLYKGGYMRAFSVGFQNEVVEYDEEENKVTLKKNHLFEISTVNVPANALALAKSKGIDTSALEKHLNQKEGRVLSAKNRSTLEKARDTINEVLAQDEGKSINQPSNDTAVSPQKVETPSSKGVKQQPARIINKAVRALLAEKRNLTN